MTRPRILVLCLLAVLFITPPSLLSQEKGNGMISIILPAEAIRQTINDLTPIPLETGSEHLEGTIVIESIDRLEMRGNTIFLHGVLSGQNLVATTTIADQAIHLKLGELRLPMACKLALRFDSKQKKLFCRPDFSGQEQQPTGKSADAVLPLLTALGNREYPIDLKQIQPLAANIGKQTVPIAMEPVGIRADNNQLLLEMQAVVGKAKRTAAAPVPAKR